MQPLSCDLWLMEENAMRQFTALAASDIRADIAEVRASRQKPDRQKSIAVLPVHGVLEARQSFIGELLGMSSYERLGNEFDALMADESCAGIILDVMSPGGMVYGCQELAHKIHSARGQGKPIIAVANPMAASGGYWLAAAADRIVAPPSADVGSVGVIWEHVDVSQALENEGTKVSVIRSTNAPHKAETSNLEPLSDEARQNMQARADAIHAEFAADLAKFRGVTVADVNEHFGKGRLVSAKEALNAGMIDRVDTFQGIAMKMVTGRIKLGSERSQDEWELPTVRELRQQELAALEALIGERGDSEEIVVDR